MLYVVIIKEDKYIVIFILFFAASGLFLTYDSIFGYILFRMRCVIVGEIFLSVLLVIIIFVVCDLCVVCKFLRIIVVLRIFVENNIESRIAEAAIGFGEFINSFIIFCVLIGMWFS